MRILTFFFIFLGLVSNAKAADLISFWDQPQHGGNSFNRLPPDQAYFDALRKYGATWVRLSHDKWKPAQHDFLMGNADRYEGIPPEDLATLNMDYELGSDKVNWKYWEAIEANKPDPVKRQATAEFEPIRKRLQPWGRQAQN